MRLRSGDRTVDLIVNLEEIWQTGAIVEGEPAGPRPVTAGFAQIQSFSGRVLSVEEHEFGWRAEIQFSPLTPWSIELFCPQHLLGITPDE